MPIHFQQFIHLSCNSYVTLLKRKARKNVRTMSKTVALFKEIPQRNNFFKIIQRYSIPLGIFNSTSLINVLENSLFQKL